MPREGAVGRVILTNLVSSGFAGPVWPVWPVNPQCDAIDGQVSYSDAA
jgi:acyl-CoA synthetase (NDP forming)